MDWSRPARNLSLTIAALLLLAAVWYALYAFELTTPTAPVYDDSMPRPDSLRAFFAYQRSVAWQELGFTLVAALAFLLLAPFGVVLRELLGPRTPEAAIAGALFIVAAGLLVAGQVVQIGTQRAILSLSESQSSDPQVLISIWDTGLVTSNWLENGGYFSLALAIAGVAAVVRGTRPAPRAWIALSVILSAALIVVVVSQALEAWDIYEIVLPLSGAVLSPAWFLLASRTRLSSLKEKENAKKN